MELESIEIPVEKLLLDPNNYRFQEDEDFTYCPADKSHLETVQKNAYTKLRAYGLKELKDSITSNGFLPVERIIVEPYTPSQGYFRVIEGNRRVAALKWIELENNSSGIKAPDKVIGTLDAVPCLVVKGNGESSYFREALMGIRHVGGIKQWGGYQRAKLIAALRDEHELAAFIHVVPA